MKSQMPRAHLLRLLDLVRAMAPAESTTMLPVFSHVRLEAEMGAFRVATMCPDGAARAAISAEVTEAGVCAVSLKRLYDTVKMLAGVGDRELVTLELATNRCTIKGADGKVNLPTLDSPDQLLDAWKLELPESAAAVAVGAEALRSALQSVRHAIAHEGSRPALRGVCLDITPENTWAVGTDGARMAIAKLGGAADKASQVVLAVEGIEALLVALEGQSGVIQLDCDPAGAIFEAPMVKIKAQGVVAVAYPPWRQAMSMLDTRTPGGVVNAQRLASILRRSIAVCGANAAVHLSVSSDGVAATAESSGGHAEGSVPASVATPPCDVETVPVNPRFAADALDACGAIRPDVAVSIALQQGRPVALHIEPHEAQGSPRCAIMRVTG